MKKSIYSIAQHTDLKRKDIEQGLFEAADLLLYLQSQLTDIPEQTAVALREWMENRKDLITALADIRLTQMQRGGMKPDDLYMKLYRHLLPQTDDTDKE